MQEYTDAYRDMCVREMRKQIIIMFVRFVHEQISWLKRVFEWIQIGMTNEQVQIAQGKRRSALENWIWMMMSTCVLGEEAC